MACSRIVDRETCICGQPRDEVGAQPPVVRLHLLLSDFDYQPVGGAPAQFKQSRLGERGRADVDEERRLSRPAGRNSRWHGMPISTRAAHLEGEHA